ncbi:MAG: PilW family protein [Coxiellaceae bacterium]|nr:PilW family protein [Coxiellaceae bacterium]
MRSGLQTSKAFSFIEMIISIALLGFILFGMVKIYLSITHSRHIQSAVTNMQHTGHLALGILDKYIRAAGDTSCLPAGKTITPEQALIGYHGQSLPAGWKIKPLLDTDVIVVGECTSIKGVKKFRRFAFYVAYTGRKVGMGEPVSALYKKPIDSKAVEVVPGLNGLRFSYGESEPTAKDVNQYVGAPAVRDWSTVKSVQVGLNLVTYDPELQRVTGSRLYKTWHSYIALQNRIK